MTTVGLPGEVPAEGAADPDTAIAVIGVSCRFPQAENPRRLWELLASGHSAVTEVPPDRWTAPASAGAPRWGAFLDRPADFDAGFFGLSPREAPLVDPQQRLVLELGWEALEDARVVPREVSGSRLGTFVGVNADDYAKLLTRHPEALSAHHTMPGTQRGVIANRLSAFLGACGPSFTVDSAQSSSLVALHLACESLRSGESELAIACGVNLHLMPEGVLLAASLGGLSPDGRCYTFDARANGYVPGEGGGAVVLKRLHAAVEDGDRILCLVRGSATNNDSRGETLTTPTADSQADVVTRACARAGLSPAVLRYVELHGPGTPVGDPVEAAALGAAIGRRRPSGRPLAVGSVKTNIGHLSGAGGIAGFIKTVLALRHRLLPASLNFETPNPRIPLDDLNLRVQRELGPWPGDPEPDEEIVAGVSSFGMGGSNCHVVLSDWRAEPAEEHTGGRRGPRPPLVPWIVSGRSEEALRGQAHRLARFAEGAGGTDPVDVGWSLAASRSRFGHRAVVLGTDGSELAGGLSELAEEGIGNGVVSGSVAHGGVGAVFSGQGAQRVGMGRGLSAFPAFAEALDEVLGVFDEVAGGVADDIGLSDELREFFGVGDGFSARMRDVMSGDADGLDGTGWAQPALFAFEVALWRLLVSWGVRPSVVAGHSLGELVAAHVAGVWSLRDAARLVLARGWLMYALPAGEGVMVAVGAGPEAVRPGGGVEIAAVNGPESVVLSGPVGPVLAEVGRLKESGARTRRLAVSHASHSALMEPMFEAYGRVVRSVRFREPALPVVSSVTGRMAAPEVLREPAYWVHQVRKTVRFADAVAAMREHGVATFLEIGPDAVLTPMVRESARPRTDDERTRPAVAAVPSCRRDRDEARTAATALAHLWVRGEDVDWSPFFDRARLVDLPTYAFQRERFWIEGRPAPDKPAAGPAPSPAEAAEAAEPAPARTGGRLGSVLGSLPEPAQRQAVLDAVCEQAATVMDHTGRVEAALTFKDLGFDSLMAQELADGLAARTGLPLGGRLVFDFPTPRALARHLHEEITGQRRAEVAHVAEATAEPLAIVGMACRYPGGVSTPEQLWQLVATGEDAISEYPADRGWDLDGLYHPDPGHWGTSYTRNGGFLTGASEFDAEFFGISPREALAMDPQQRLLLETSWEALERAGIDPRSRRGSATGTYIGATSQYYGPRAHQATEGFAGFLLTGNTPSVMSGRIAYALGLEGPAVTVDTACSSSLVALHLAGRALRSGECDLALAGGATVMASPDMFVEFSRQRGLSADGRCKAFSAGADGTGWAEGVGVLVVERLSDARRLGHRVLAVVRGSAVNQDGASNGLTAPNGPSQQRVIRAALADAGVSAAEVDVVEAHGTGTRLGDPIEAEALFATYGRGRDAGRPLWLGSLKSNIGHAQAAAGVAGVMKTVLAMRHGVLPRTLHVDEPTPQVDWSAGGVELLTEARAWPRGSRPRRAGVSSFGISGTNAHLILEEAPEEAPEEAAEAAGAPGGRAGDALAALPWILSGRTGPALREQARRLVSFLAEQPEVPPADVGASLVASRSLHERRAVVTGGSRQELLDGVRAVAEGTAPIGAVRDGAAAPRPVFVFPGQGAQWVGMARELLSSSAVFAARMDECAAALAPFADWSLLDVLDDPEALERVDVVQPALWAVMVSLAEVWRSYGVEPAAVVGHSQGEIAAAVVAGGLSLREGARVAALRSRAIGNALSGRGGMVSVAAPADAVRRQLAELDGTPAVAAVNGPSSTVVSGTPEALDALLARCERDGVRARRLAVDYASHSAQVDEVRERILADLSPLEPRAFAVPFFSTVTGEWLTGEPGPDAAYWVRNLRETVRFDDAVRALVGAGFGAFVECSPHPVLTASVQETVEAAGGDAVVVGSLRRDDAGVRRVLASLGEAFVRGVPVDWSRAYAGSGAGHVDLPTYAFQHERYWWEPDAAPAPEAGAEDAAFWQAVADGDAETLVGALGVEEDALGHVLPALRSWRQRQLAASAVDGWRYRTRWVPVATARRPELSGTWLLAFPEGCADRSVVEAVAGAVRDHGGHVATLEVPAGAARERIARLLEDARAAGGEYGGVLSLLSLADVPPAGAGVPRAGLTGTLTLFQALGDTGVTGPLWCLTSGATAVTDGEQLYAPAGRMVWGLGRIAALEHPERFGGLVDLPEQWDGSAGRLLAAALAGAGGEDQVAVRPPGLFARRLARAARPAPDARWGPRGTVLVTGGTGGLGGQVARWLARSGAEHVVLAGRRGPEAPRAVALREELEATGVRVTVAACDVTDREALARLLDDVSDGCPLTAVVHTAAVLDDAVVERLTPGQVNRVLRVKADGAWYLHELTRGMDLDAFVLFSSVAGTLGASGQGNYAPGNACLDALAEHRHGLGLPATSVAWGPWAEEGMAEGGIGAVARRHGLPHMAPELAVSALADAAGGGEPCVVIADIAWDRFHTAYTASRPSPLLADLPDVRRLAAAAGPGAEAAPDALAGRLAGSESRAEREAAVLAVVRTHVASVLGYAGADAVDPTRTFKDLGLDSVTAVDLSNRLRTATGLRLPSTVAFDRPNARALAAHLCAELLPDPGNEPAPAAADASATGRDPVVIVGMSCRFPGDVRSPDDLWRMLDRGGEGITPFPGDRGWDVAALYDPDSGADRAGTSCAVEGGFLHDAGDFDAEFFGISPREALATDPQQRLLLETSWEALERAGIDPSALKGTSTAVFTGTNGQDYLVPGPDVPEEASGYVTTGSTAGVLSGRVAYTLGLEGPAVTVDTACSSSLVALHLAVRSLRAGECALALVSGVSVMATPGLFTDFTRQGGLAPDGRCKAFAATADGAGFSEGVGVLVVERLSEAKRLGHRALAVVRGSAVNQDGASNGLTAPSGPSQQRVIRAALVSAGVSAAEVDVVEAHGTGTTLGDPIEAQALLATYGRGRDVGRPLWLGSVKSNIGHTQAAAGVAGVIKTVLAMRHGVLPATLHADEPSPHVDWSAGTVRLLTEATDWQADGRPRRAGISSFGISGTNAHVILEEPTEPAPEQTAAEAGAHGGPAAATPVFHAGGITPWVLSAKSGAAVREQAARLLPLAGDGTGQDAPAPADVGFSLSTTRAVFDHRAVVLGTDRAAVARGLAALADGREAPGVTHGAVVGSDGRAVFVFPGQGWQWLGMAVELLDSSPVFAERMEECAAALAPFVPWSPLDVVRDAEGPEWIDRVDVVQPVMWAVMVSLAETWRALGVVPSAVVGHSQGEIAAAVVAGGLSLEDGARVVAVRSRALRALSGSGAMASVGLPAQAVEGRLAAWGGRLSVAAVNAPAAVVVSGDVEAVGELLAKCEAEGVRARRLPVDYASHCAHVEKIESELERGLAGLAPRTSSVPFCSTVTGGLLDTAELDARYWYRNARRTVRFDEAVRVLLGEGFRVFVEASAHPALVTSVAGTADDCGVAAVAVGSLRRGEGGQDRLLASVAEAFAGGAEVDWPAVFAGSGARRVDVPTYPFQHRRYWLDARAAAGARDAASMGLEPTEHPLLGAAVPLPGSEGFLLTGRLSPRQQPWLTDHTMLGRVAVPGSALVEMALRAGDEAGCGRLEELTLEVPLVLADEGAVQVQVAVGGPREEGRRELSVYARGGGAWTCHARGVLSAGGTASGPKSAGAWPQEGAETVDFTGTYARMASAGLAYEPAFRGLRSVRRRGEEVFAEVELPEMAGTGHLAVHPALLDAALYAWLACADGTDTVRLPFSWSGVSVHGPVAEATEVRIRLVPDGGDALSMTVADTAGTPLLSVDALVTRPVREVELAAAVGAREDGHREDWVPAAPPAAQEGGARRCAVMGEDVLGLAEAWGAESFCDLRALGGRAPEAPDAAVVYAGPAGEGTAQAGDGTPGVVREWLTQERFAGARLAVVTRGAVTTGAGEDVRDPATVPVWERVRSAQAENPGRLALVDVDGSAVPLDALHRAVLAGEERLAVRGGEVLVPRPAGPGERPRRRATTRRAPAPADASRPEEAPLVRRLSGLADAERRRVLLRSVQEHAAAVLGLGSVGAVAPDRGFLDLGFTSLTGVELRNRLNAATGLRLPTTLVFDCPSPAALAEHLGTELAGTAAADGGGGTSLAAQLDRLEATLLGTRAEPDDATRAMVASRLGGLLSRWAGTRDGAAGRVTATGAAAPDTPAREATAGSADHLESAEADELFRFIDREFGAS